ncbi:MAG: helix-turn-helix transcriptional regulator [Mailhella sp.]|nr:helix-turn-helix transcriptional regulator [Mailhella sp.]
MKSYPEFGAVLRKLRVEKGLSQEALASRLDMVSNGYISRLESGQKNPTLDMLFRISEALEMKPWEFLKRMDEERQN